MKEHQLQKSIIDYIKLQYPEALYCASAGGLRTSIIQAKRMKSTGYVKGFPDIAILEPRLQTNNKYYCGLFLEVKTINGRPTKDQLWWREQLNQRWYVSEIVYSFDEAKIILDKYLNNQL